MESTTDVPGSRTMDSAMHHPEFSLLVVADCPNEAPATEAFREALALVGHPGAPLRRVVVDDEDLARRLGFLGSPSFHVDGQDLFPRGGAPSVACRLYPGLSGGLVGVPTVINLTKALLAAQRLTQGQPSSDKGTGS